MKSPILIALFSSCLAVAGILLGYLGRRANEPARSAAVIRFALGAMCIASIVIVLLFAMWVMSSR